MVTQVPWLSFIFIILLCQNMSDGFLSHLSTKEFPRPCRPKSWWLAMTMMHCLGLSRNMSRLHPDLSFWEIIVLSCYSETLFKQWWHPHWFMSSVRSVDQTILVEILALRPQGWEYVLMSSQRWYPWIRSACSGQLNTPASLSSCFIEGLSFLLLTQQ